jgi:hypothetical protein
MWRHVVQENSGNPTRNGQGLKKIKNDTGIEMIMQKILQQHEEYSTIHLSGR